MSKTTDPEPKKNTDETSTLSSVTKADHQVDEQREAELLEALEKTHQQFGNALRRLAQ